MEPNTQPGTPTEQPVTPELAINSVPDAIEPDTSSSNVIQPVAPAQMSPVAETTQPAAPFSPAPAPVVMAAPSPTPAKKKTTLILIVVLGVLVLAAAGLIIYVTTMS